MLSRPQKAIIRKAARLQEESFMRIIQEGRLEEILKELQEEGYEVTLSDLEERVAKDLELWDKVKDAPENFFQILDEVNLGMVRHLLVNDFKNTDSVKGLHRKLNLFEEIQKFLN